MPLQNRISPFAELFASPARGTLFGNRGGRFHSDDKTLTARRWASRQWICCVLEFKGRQRDIWGRYYTELFFLDEVTALAAGHRPCFECRRRDAERFAQLFAGQGPRTSAPEMDDILHRERLNGRVKRTYRARLDTLPDGTMIAVGGEAFALRGGHLLRWTPQGYDAARPRPRGTEAEVLTPPSIVAVLQRGYVPMWHPSAGTLTQIK